MGLLAKNDNTIINNNAFFYESYIEFLIPFPKGSDCVGTFSFPLFGERIGSTFCQG